MEILKSRVLLIPRDLDASLDFYEDRLGLTRSREFGRPPQRGIVFFLGGGELELHEAGGPDPERPAPPGIRLWAQVPDVHATCTALERAGVTIREGPEQQPWGLIEAVVHDPDGLPLILVEVPAEHPLRRDTR